VEIIHNLQLTLPLPLNPPLFMFKFCKKAADNNAKILAENNFDMNKIIEVQHPSQISYGSQFRLLIQLEELLSHHPLWTQLKEILSNGASFPLDEISDQDRLTDLNFHANHGNHKSAFFHKQIFQDIIKEDVERGFALALPVTALHFLPKASLASLGCVKQSTLDASGNQSTKYRMTLNQSFPGPSKLSVNFRVQQSKLQPILYSFVISLCIHYKLSLCQ